MSRFFKTPFTLSTVAAIALVALIIGVLARRLFAPTSTSANANAPASSNRVDVIVKATDSQFWQAMLAGSQAAGKDWGVQVGLFGATSEADVSAQVGLVENSMSRNVKAIVLAASSSQALNGEIDRARSQGIKVITFHKHCTYSYKNKYTPAGLLQVNDAISANPGLVGIYADNNVSADGAAQSIQENKAQNRIAAVGFDSDPQEINALKNGTLQAIVVQN